MKIKVFLSFALLSILLVSFNKNDEKDIDNNQLYNKIEYAFSDLIKEVTNVVFLEENDNFFYIVEGFEEGKHTSFIIKVSEESYYSKGLNIIHFENASSNNIIEFCHWKWGVCSPPSDDVVVRCGVYYDGECFPY